MNETPQESEDKNPQDLADEYFWAAEELKKNRPRSRPYNVKALIVFALILLCVSPLFFKWNLKGIWSRIWNLFPEKYHDSALKEKIGPMFVGSIGIIFIIFVGYILFLILQLLSHRAKGTTLCPRCHSGFANCVPNHCHCCGRPLANKKCENCSVDWNVGAAFGGLSETLGNNSPIRFCPGCGVFLDSDHRREQLGIDLS